MYHQTHFCQTTKSADKMFKIFQQMRTEFMENLHKDPEGTLRKLWADESLLPQDKHCQFQLGITSDKLPTSMIQRQNFTCSMCKTLSKLLAGNKHTVGTTIMLECGHKSGCTLNIETYKNDIFKISRDDDVLRIIANNIDTMYDDSLVFELDNFSNILLVTLVLEKIWAENVRKAYIGFSCASQGYILNDSLQYPSIDTMNDLELSPTTVDGIIGQMLVSLKQYSTAVFLIGCPSEESIGFSDESISFGYGEYTVDCDLTLKLKHMMYNSVDIVDENKRLRIVNVNPVDKMLLRHSFSSLVNEMTVVSTDPLVVSLSPKQFDIYQRYVKVGVPLFASTWNVYSMMIILMMQKNIYKGVMADKKLKGIWEHMWSKNDLKEINASCSQSGTLPSLKNSVPNHKVNTNINLRPFLVDKEIKIGILDDLLEKYLK